MIYPGFHWWRAHQRGADCGAWAGRHGFTPGFEGWERHAGFGERSGDGGAFGVRRPLRFLAYKLDLDERQVSELARILADLKTERAQADVDWRRTLASFADAVAGEHFDEAKAGEAGSLRVQSAERLRGAVLKALGRIHALLEADQRERLAYLIRTGTLTL